jgi:Tfp pilus assembly protein PilX
MISKLQLNKLSIISKAENEKGIVLIGAISLVAVLALLGTVSVVTTTTEIIISKNHKTSVQASYAAQAGTEEARARLRLPSSDSNYAGDPAANPDPTWSAYILTSSSWQTSDDQNYVGTYTNYIPTTSSHTNTTVETNTLQTTPDIDYWVKIRHKREADLKPNEPYVDNGSTSNDIIYYGYATPSSRTLEQFTTTAVNLDTTSPVDIITSYGSSGTSSGIIEIQTRKLSGPQIFGCVYGGELEGNGAVTIYGDDDCNSDSVPAAAFVTIENFGGGVNLESDAGGTIQINPALDLAAYVDKLESLATVVLDDDDDPVINASFGSSSNYEVVFCDATQLSDQVLDMTNVTGHGTLAVRGNIDVSGNIDWNGTIIATGEIRLVGGGGTGVIYGAIFAGAKLIVSGTLDIIYSTCDIDNVYSSFAHSKSRWEDIRN